MLRLNPRKADRHHRGKMPTLRHKTSIKSPHKPKLQHSKHRSPKRALQKVDLQRPDHKIREPIGEILKAKKV